MILSLNQKYDILSFKAKPTLLIANPKSNELNF